ncbi:MAG: GPR endopeptidase [Eubacteriaceae bacterium]|nr:GPR endopeptidase [Eubacteriaceae bacterium]
MLIPDLIADLASEYPDRKDPFTTKIKNGITIDRIDISKIAAKELARPAGTYFNLEFDRAVLDRENLESAMESCIEELRIGKHSSVMVIGFGNKTLGADKFGSYCAELIDVGEKPGGCVYSIAPSVEGMTGIDSGLYASTLAKLVNADLIIMVDAMLTRQPAKLLNCLQISNTSLPFGEGVAKKRSLIGSLPENAKMMSIGYATTTPMNLSSLKSDSAKNQHLDFDTIAVTPAECDYYVGMVCEASAKVVNGFFNRMMME